MQYPIGALKDPYDPRDILFGSVEIPTLLPRKFSLREKQSPVPIQNFGSCVGFGAKAIKEYQEKLEYLEEKILSGRFAYAVAKTLDGISNQEGTYPRVMMKVLAGVGISYDSSFPNNPAPATHQEYISPIPDEAMEEAIQFRIKGFARCLTVSELKQAIYNYGPVLVTLNVYDTFDNPINGFIGPRHNQQYNRGGHAIVAVGWDDDKEGIGAFEIKNSWGTGWGDQGYAFVAYNYDGQFPFMDALAPVDFVDATATTGAPISLEMPLEGQIVVTQEFGANPDMYAPYGLDGHNGVDLRAKGNVSVFALDDGEVIFAGIKGAYGNCVIIQHLWGVSLYAHLSSLTVEDIGPDGKFPTISKKDEVGKSGNTGNSTGEHLHLGIRINGVKNPGFFDWVDPMPYLLGKKVNNMIIVNSTSDPATKWLLDGSVLRGYADFAAFQKDIAGRLVIELTLPDVEFNKIPKSGAVIKT
ncbi:peptidoglycan DD-metalloendopeptidase family protein [Candidatus Dojkabacteria bacterium]|jgi:murein DD-endopeptidase MepM/ murein hydrolase activator NlpD|nr:peptidoglycan DD-metalloendopeptidase family protein [Candidatus Dojkabacteria bacterium]